MDENLEYARFEKFYLGIEEQDWVDNHQFYYDWNIKPYLKSNGFNEISKLFASAGITAKVNEGDIDLNEGIAIDISDDCQKQILKNALEADNILMDIISDIFNTKENGVKLLIKKDILNGSNASTSNIIKYDPINRECFIKISFDENYLKSATNISIARTMIHEALHALLVYGVMEGHLIGEDDDSFDQLMDAFLLYLNTNNNSSYSGQQHEILSQYQEDISSSLHSYGLSAGLNLSPSYYDTLSWGGLMGTSAFKFLYPQFLKSGNINPDWVTINNTLFAEQNNSTMYSDGQGNIIIPKGTPCP